MILEALFARNSSSIDLTKLGFTNDIFQEDETVDKFTDLISQQLNLQHLKLEGYDLKKDVALKILRSCS